MDAARWERSIQYEATERPVSWACQRIDVAITDLVDVVGGMLYIEFLGPLNDLQAAICLQVSSRRTTVRGYAY